MLPHLGGDRFCAKGRRRELFDQNHSAFSDMMTPASPSRALSPALRLITAAIAVLALLVPALVLRFGPPPPPVTPVRVAARVVPKTELPPVEPVAFQDLAPRDAVAFNATIPFVTGPMPAARPFRVAGSDADRARAIDCMATAVLYEAGDDTVGERAVAQVVINRVRHPAFPKTICGVVFQGSERSTGCQFTFSCDGALTRWHPTEAAWKRARDVATAALTGLVDRTVGYATHYHTNWVVPYWSSSLDKIAAVGTHLFFRWTGWWGTPPAFTRAVSKDEPVIAALGGLSDAHRTGMAALAEVNPAQITAAATGDGTGAQPQSIDPNSFLVTLDPRMAADDFPAVALKTCGARVYCKLMAWTDKALTPTGLPLGQRQIAAMAFSYLRDTPRGYEKALWNCGQYKRAAKGDCMKVQMLGAPAAMADAAPTLPEARKLAAVPVEQGKAPTPAGFTLKALPPDGLAGVRRKDNVARQKAAPSSDGAPESGNTSQAP